MGYSIVDIIFKYKDLKSLNKYLYIGYNILAKGNINYAYVVPVLSSEYKIIMSVYFSNILFE
jgi:hypothetical protein